MSELIYNMNGYPEPEHIYLGKSSILVFTLFPVHQDSHKAQVDEYNANECFYNPDEPLYYDIEFRVPFKEKNGKVIDCPIDIDSDEWYLARRVDLATARNMCKEFIEKWCEEKGLALQ